jgi:hypothetical protein
MTDKIQHTANHLRERMLARYGDAEEHKHKHNKNHLEYRMHERSHPASLTPNGANETEPNGSTGLVKQLNLKRIRKRLGTGRVH